MLALRRSKKRHAVVKEVGVFSGVLLTVACLHNLEHRLTELQGYLAVDDILLKRVQHRLFDFVEILGQIRLAAFDLLQYSAQLHCATERVVVNAGALSCFDL